jgi:hypothetical protein
MMTSALLRVIRGASRRNHQEHEQRGRELGPSLPALARFCSTCGSVLRLLGRSLAQVDDQLVQSVDEIPFSIEAALLEYAR